MAQPDAPDVAGEQIRQAASEVLDSGVDIRSRVHDLTLSALKQRRFDGHGMRQVVRAVTEGIALGAEGSRTDMRRALSDAFSGLDQALVKSTEAGRAALRRLVASSRDFSDHEFRQALANMRRIEDDFLATVGQVAEAAGEKVRPELNSVLSTARSSGTETGKQVAAMMSEFAQRFGAASLDVTIAGVQAAGEFGARFAMLASGILSGVADALRPAEPATPADEAKGRNPPQQS